MIKFDHFRLIEYIGSSLTEPVTLLNNSLDLLVKTMRSTTYSLLLLFALQTFVSDAHGLEFFVQPNDYPDPSSVGVELRALGSRDSATSSLSGFGTVDLDWDANQQVTEALIADMELQLDDKIDISLIFGTFTANVEPGATQVRMVEPGFSTPVENGQFSQTENIFAFEGELLLNGEIFDVSTFGEIVTDLEDIQIRVTEDYVSTEASIELEFEASVGIFPIRADIAGSVYSQYLFGDINSDGVLNGTDIDLLADGLRRELKTPEFDVNLDNIINADDYDSLIEDRIKTYYGDSNLDGVFDTGDFVFVFQRGQYEDDVVGNSKWADGDWNGDGDFDTSDLVTAFQYGGFEAGPRAIMAVPEPSMSLLGIGLAFLFLTKCSRRSRQIA